MARRARIADCLYLTASGKYQTWWRNENDIVVWGTVQSLEDAIQLRDQKRKDRAEHIKVPKVLRDMRRMAELLQPPKPPTDQCLAAVVDYNEDPTPDDAHVYPMYS